MSLMKMTESDSPEMNDTQKSQFLPALRFSWLTRFYDPVAAMTTREKVFRMKLLEQAELCSGNNILDLACGTGTFALMVKAEYPDVSVTGLDIDPRILALARKKTCKADANIQFDSGNAGAMPYAPKTFDVVFSSLFFHHLDSKNKLLAMKDVFRVLKPGGVFHVCDWGIPANLYSKLMFNMVRVLDGFAVTEDNVNGRLPVFMKNAGFVDVHPLDHIGTILGTLDMISARKPMT